MIVNKLIQEASRSSIVHQHAAVAIRKGKIISPMKHNYIRYRIGHLKTYSTVHAEIAVINYLLCSYQRGRNRLCVL